MKKLAVFAVSLSSGLGLCACSNETPQSGTCKPKAGTICTVAGTGIAGLADEGTLARDASLYLPMDATVGPDGLLYIADWNNHRIRRVDGAGALFTVAGSGLLGDGPPGSALQAAFNHPTQIVFDPLGRMVIAAWHNSKVKRVDLATGILEDICGTGARQYNGDGGPAEKAIFDLPVSVAFDGDGNMFVSDQANQMIRKVGSDMVVSRYAGQCIIGTCDTGRSPLACPTSQRVTCQTMAAGGAGGSAGVSAGAGAGGLAGNSGAGGAGGAGGATGERTPLCTQPCAPAFAGDDGLALDARLAQPVGQAADPGGRIAIAPDGDLIVADTKNQRIRRIDRELGTITTIAGNGTVGFAGDGGPATDAQLNNPTDVAVASDGTIYVADTYNSCVRAILPDATIRTFAGVCGQPGFANDGKAPDGAQLNRPYGLGLSADGALYIADTYNHRVRVVAH
jgi:sugar lactone lactonase YvrE